MLVGGLAMIVGTLGACDSGWPAMGPMMHRRVGPTSFESNGERIYFTGLGVSGRPIPFRGGDMRVQMHGGGCAACHGSDRRGGNRMMPRFWLVAPALTPQTLFGEHEDTGGGHGDHEGYTEATLARAITEGIDPAGTRLDEAMPRWAMSRQDLADVIGYLRGPHGEAGTDRGRQ